MNELSPLNLSELVQIDFPENQYYRETTSKNQVVIHHTVSGGYAQGVINWWNQDPQRIATHFIIQQDGTIFQLYSSKYWAHHLGVKADFLKNMGFTDYGTRNTLLNKSTIGIEICRWGGLVKDDNGFHPAKWDTTTKKYVPYTKITIPVENVQSFPRPFRDFYHFEKYTSAQLISVSRMLTYLCDKFGISKEYYGNMWDVSKDALAGKPGIWTHVSYRPDKSDCFPQTELINMLQNIGPIKTMPPIYNTPPPYNTPPTLAPDVFRPND